MNSLAASKWGASKKCQLIIYRTLIRSIIDYGSAARDTAPVSAKRKLDTIQSIALRICCVAMRGTAAAALQNNCGEMPLSLRRHKLQRQHVIKMKETEDHPTESILKDNWTIHYGRYKTGQEPFAMRVKEFNEKTNIARNIKEQTETWLIRSNEIDLSLRKEVKESDPPELCKARALALTTKHHNKLAISTDGSKAENRKVAAAFFLYQSRK
jgi:hypothetical protein